MYSSVTCSDAIAIVAAAVATTTAAYEMKALEF